MIFTLCFVAIHHIDRWGYSIFHSRSTGLFSKLRMTNTKEVRNDIPETNNTSRGFTANVEDSAGLLSFTNIITGGFRKERLQGFRRSCAWNTPD